MPKVRVLALVAVLAGTLLAACTNSDDPAELQIYSGRNENLIKPLLEEFARETGTDIRVRYGDTAELTPTLLEEGANTRADVFISQDAGALAALASRGFLARLPKEIAEQVDPRFRDPEGRWVGLSGRARVITYNTDALRPADLPQSVFELTDPKWRGKVGFPPTNASFVSWVSALIEEVGAGRTRAFLEGLKANSSRTYANNVAAIDAVSRGEIQVALVNHYYLFNEFKEQRTAPIANYYPGQSAGGEGTFVNVAGVAVIQRSDQKKAAERFVEYLLARKAQEYFRTQTAEYPLAAGVEPIPELRPLADIRTIDVPLSSLGEDLEASLALLKSVGLT